MEVDKSNLKKVILESSKQLTAELDFYNQLSISRRQFNKIIICGVGGSSIPVDLFNYLKRNKYPSLVPSAPMLAYRDYDLPPDADENCLIICDSFSGNTEETLSSFKKAQQLGLEIAGITCGGKLAELLQSNKIPWVKIPDTKIQPRHGLGYQLAGLVRLFTAYGLLLHTAQDSFVNIQENIKPQDTKDHASQLAEKLVNKIPVIYSSRNNEALARVAKIKFNEDVKIPSFFNSFPELNHNEMIGWTKFADMFHFLFLADQNDHPRTKKRMTVTAETLKNLGGNYDFIEMTGKDPLEKMFWFLNLSSWLAYELAIKYGIDPTPVELVEKFKARLND